MSGLITAAVIGAGAVAYSASSASDSAAAANATNAANVTNTNQLDLYKYNDSRGANGSAIYPTYGGAFEKNLFNDTLGIYDSTAGITGATTSGIINRTQPAQAGADATVNGIFNGGLLQTDLNNQAPVSGARLQGVATQKQGTLEALMSTVNRINAINAGKGYSGDSFGNRLLSFQANRDANTTAANALTTAQLANATDVRSIQANDVNRRLQNVGLPGQVAQSDVNLATLPATTAEQQQVGRQNLFSNFRIGVGQPFQYSPLPQVNPVASTGQIVGQGVGALASGLGNYYAQSNLASNAGVPKNYDFGSGYGGTASYGGGTVPVPDSSGNYAFGAG